MKQKECKKENEETRRQTKRVVKVSTRIFVRVHVWMWVSVSVCVREFVEQRDSSLIGRELPSAFSVVRRLTLTRQHAPRRT